METATYIGPKVLLQGKTALVRSDPANGDVLLAQFDDRALGSGLACGWTAFNHLDFEVCEGTVD